jgi:hypothetical protein
MTHTHTPSPWHITDEGSQIVIQTFSDHPTGTLARIYRTDELARSNARLIAAAPSLLNALIAIKTQAELTALTFPNAPGRGDLLTIAGIAGEAIAKAEGNA